MSQRDPAAESAMRVAVAILGASLLLVLSVCLGCLRPEAYTAPERPPCEVTEEGCEELDDA